MLLFVRSHSSQTVYTYKNIRISESTCQIKTQSSLSYFKKKNSIAKVIASIWLSSFRQSALCGRLMADRRLTDNGFVVLALAARYSRLFSLPFKHQEPSYTDYSLILAFHSPSTIALFLFYNSSFIFFSFHLCWSRASFLNSVFLKNFFCKNLYYFIFVFQYK